MQRMKKELPIRSWVFDKSRRMHGSIIGKNYENETIIVNYPYQPPITYSMDRIYADFIPVE